jgi:DEAD/DEAH box helicase domain-containing protein
MGSMSFAQLMREAYPGAIYYYATLPYRVTRVNVKTKVITVRREKRYTTQPQKTLPAVFPRLAPGGLFDVARMDGLLSLEANLLVRESIRGIIEQRGRNENQYPYPLAREMGFFQDQPFFSRNYFTTGIVLAHPALAAEGVALEDLAAILYEAFMLIVPFERQDIGFAADHFRQTRFPVEGGALVEEGRPFVTIYDQTYGSLRLSARLRDPALLGQVLAEALLLAGRQESLKHSPASLEALRAMTLAVLRHPREQLDICLNETATQASRRAPDAWERVVMPGSKGLMVRTNEEFHVMRILNTPAGLSYEGTPASMVGTGASMMPLLSDVAEIPGESQAGWYEIATGALEPASAGEDGVTIRVGAPQPPPEPDPDWLRRVLSVYFDPPALARLAQTPGQLEKPALIEALLDTRRPGDLLEQALAIYLDLLAQEP